MKNTTRFALIFLIIFYTLNFNNNTVVNEKSDYELYEEEGRREIFEWIKKGLLDYSSVMMNVKPIFDSESLKGNIYIVNSNIGYKLVVDIIEYETGNLMYKSPILNPNEIIENCILIEPYPEGVYEAIAETKFYDIYTNELVKTMKLKVLVTVQ